MTRKDYQKIAAILAKHRNGRIRLTDNVISDIAVDLAEVFTEDNPNFQQSLFFKAVLVEPVSMPESFEDLIKVYGKDVVRGWLKATLD